MRSRKQDNKERYEEYKRRYKWNQFNTDELVHESDEAEESLHAGDRMHEELKQKVEQVTDERIDN